MEERNGITLVGLIVTILILILVIFILLPIITGIDPKLAKRVICGTNLKSLGTAMTVYANDYDDRFPQLPGTGPWSKELGFAYDLKDPNFSDYGAQKNVGRTISASWYLLIKYADAEPKSFVCPASVQQIYDGKNPQKRDIIDLWDFGPNPYNHINYSMHNPYGKYPAADDSCSAAFAVAADMNPWFYNGNILPPGQNNQTPQVIKLNDPSTWKLGNAVYHGREGQNVLYADGHNSYETRPDVGVRNDNIYTYWRIKTDEKPNELDQRVGQPPTGRSPENDAQDKDDSFLAI